VQICVAWHTAISACAFPAPYKIPTLTSELRPNNQALKNVKGADWCSAWAMVSVFVALYSTFFYCETPAVSFVLLSLQLSKETIKLSNSTFSSQNGGVVGEMCPIYGYCPYLPGEGGGLHGDDHLQIRSIYDVRQCRPYVCRMNMVGQNPCTVIQIRWEIFKYSTVYTAYQNTSYFLMYGLGQPYLWIIFKHG